MRNQGLIRDSNAADQLIIYAIVGLVAISMVSIGAYVAMSAIEVPTGGRASGASPMCKALSRNSWAGPH